MPITQVNNIVRVTFRFDRQGGAVGNEIVECGVTYRAASVPTDAAVLHAILADMATAALASVVANVANGAYTPDLVLNSSRVALEETNGHTIDESIQPATGALAWRGTAGGQALPWQCAWVLGLYAYEPGNFDPFGKSKRGRMYTPGPGSDFLTGNTGEMSDTNAALLANGWGQVLQELQQHDYSGFPAFSPVLGVNSRRQVAFFPVTFLRFDTKIDTQRRRANQEAGDIASAPFPHT